MTNVLEHRDVFDALADPILVADAGGKIVHANPGIEALLGWKPAELVGRLLTSLMPERLHDTDPTTLGGRPVRVPLLHEDGNEVDVDLTLSPFPGGFVVVTMRDVHDRVELERQQESLALLETLFVAAPVGLALVDRSLRYVRVNEALAAMTGRSPRDHVGRPLREVLPASFAATLEPIYRRILSTGEASLDKEVKGETRAAPGVLHHWLVNHYPVRSRRGEILGVGVVAIDITARKRAEEELEELASREQAARARAELERAHLHAIFTNAPAAMAILRGPEHVYELSNPTNNQLLGKDPTGLPVAEAFPDVGAQGVVTWLDRVFSTGEPFRGLEVPFRFPQPNGTVREGFGTFVYQPMRGVDGTTEGVIVFGFDVTEQVRARHEVEALAVDRERLIKELQAAIDARDEFLSVASHELRTPLTPLRMRLEVLARQMGDRLDGEARAWLEGHLATIARQSDRLTRLVNDLLDISRIATGKLTMNPAPNDLLSVAKQVVRDLEDEGAVARASCELVVSGETGVVGQWDPVRLEQVITNLLSNACKYGAGKPVHVHVARDCDNAVLSVTDRGIGIRREEQVRIFEKFARAVPQDQYGGLGLGLYVVRHFVEAMGGSIRVVSEPGRGATFTVRLPLPTAATQPSPPPREALH
jgi:PAS domain S-box-containing protein